MGVVIDSDPALGIISVRRNNENAVPPAASDEICSGDTKLAIASATNTAVPPHIPFTAMCRYTHQPCWLGQGESVDRPAIIDMDFNETIGTSDALFMARDPDPNCLLYTSPRPRDRG